MEATAEVSKRICAVVPAATPRLVDDVFRGTNDNQLLFIEGEGAQVRDGKPHWPDSLQIHIHDPHTALELAQQLLRAGTEALANGGRMRSPAVLMLGGKAILSE